MPHKGGYGKPKPRRGETQGAPKREATPRVGKTKGSKIKTQPRGKRG